jgi:ketosteroid isomerase-like protein
METSDRQVEQEIEKLELKDAQAALRHDLDSIERLWSDKLVVSSPANLLFTKSQLLGFFRAGLIRLKSFERRVMRVVVDRDIAVTTGSDTFETLSGADAGKTIFCSYMNCWRREDGQWKLLGRHASVVGKMKPDGTFESPGS